MSTILVVDDMAFCREPIAEALRAQGFDVVCAGGGSEALSIIRENRPDLVLLDVNMPEPDGLAVLASIRNDLTLEELPVILLTERADRTCVTAAATHRASGYLLKSQFSFEQLLDRVNTCLRTCHAVPVPADDGAGSCFSRWRAQDAQPQEARRTQVRPATHSRTPPRPAATPPARPSTPSASVATSLEHLAPVITKADVVRLVNEGLDLRPLGPSVHNVAAVTRSATCSADDVAAAVANDQALCIRLLKLANSSAYSRGHLVNSVKEAVQRIGVREVQSLVMTLGVFEQFEGASAKYVDARLFWQHSIACGLAASAIAKACKSASVEDSFLWGMVHDVGRLVLLEHVSDQYARVLDAASELGLPIEQVEAKMLLLDHCNILERALEHWSFPREFITPVVNHHQSLAAIKRLGPANRDGAATVALANRLVHALLLGGSGDDVIHPIDDFVRVLGIAPAKLGDIAREITDESKGLLVTILARTTEDHWPDLAGQTRQRLSISLRPLCVSAEPEVDAYRMFCETLAGDRNGERPNVGIIYLREAAELPALATLFDRAERKIACAGLPIIVICAKGKVDLEFAWLRARRHEIHMTPVAINTLLNSFERVLA